MVKMLNLSKGNKKLVSEGNNAFLIWNLPALVTCPNSTALCRKYCYAQKAERLYKNVKSSRFQNLAESEDPYFVTNMIYTIKEFIGKKAFVGKKVYFRIHESGDFYSYNYFQDWVLIADLFPDIQFLAYTKSIQFVEQHIEEGYPIPTNLVIRYSIWDDTEEQDIITSNELELPVFTAIPKSEVEQAELEGTVICGGSCKTCKMCYYSHNKVIACVIH